MNPQEFLDLIHGPDALIYYQVGGKTWKNKPQTFRQAESKLRWRNSEGEDICYIVNAGGTKDAQIDRINAVFTDWDCGRDDNDLYFPDDVVRFKKDAFLPALRAFVPAVSLIVETRNGFHAYWLVKPGVSADQFRDCQKRLAARFDGDSVVTNPARVMRLPGFDWVKPSSGYARFHVSVIYRSEARYSVEQVLEALPVVQEDQSGAKCAHNKCECTSTLALIVGAKPASAEHTSFSTVPEAIDYLKRQDLGEYLGTGATPIEGQKIACPFHIDRNPSGGVFPAATGHWMFKCHACNIAGTIIDMAMKLHKCAEAGALKHLFAHYSIRIDTGWKAKQREILQGNLAVINDTETLNRSYPCLYRLIGRVRRDLASKIKLAQDHLVSERCQVGGQAVFFSSLRNFHRASSGRSDHPRYSNRQNEKVDRYCLLGLMRKLTDADVPPVLLKDAMKRKLKSGHQYRMQFYTIPTYTPDVLQRANNRACQLIAAGVSVRGISPEMIKGLFGPDVVPEVYPQLQTSEPTAAQIAFRAALRQALMSAVADKGYATVRELRAEMNQQYEWTSVTARRIEKCLPQLLISLKMVKLTSNRLLKERLGINGAGYPKLILPRTALT